MSRHETTPRNQSVYRRRNFLTYLHFHKFVHTQVSSGIGVSNSSSIELGMVERIGTHTIRIEPPRITCTDVGGRTETVLTLLCAVCLEAIVSLITGYAIAGVGSYTKLTWPAWIFTRWFGAVYARPSGRAETQVRTDTSPIVFALKTACCTHPSYDIVASVRYVQNVRSVIQRHIHICT